MSINIIKSNTQGKKPSIKVFDGVEHIVVPATIIVEGVLNNALVPKEEFGKFTSSWDGRPVPVLHPQKNGEYVSANSPDVVEKNNIGFIFNTKVEGNKLKTEIWINKDKAEKLGHSELIKNIEAGKKIEVSTGYFADHETKPGNYSGKPYNVIHRNLRPDHLAVLPGQVGACSIKDGCGVYNQEEKSVMTTLSEAFKTIQSALGVKTNCECEGDDTMATLQKRVEALTSNSAFTDEQKEIIKNADEKLISVFESLVKANEDKKPEDMTDEEKAELKAKEDKEKAKEMPAANSGLTQEQVSEMIANALNGNKAESLVTEIIANGHDVFTKDELKKMEINHLEKLAKASRPRDYSGAGGYTANASVDPHYKPLGAGTGLVAMIQKEKAGDK